MFQEWVRIKQATTSSLPSPAKPGGFAIEVRFLQRVNGVGTRLSPALTKAEEADILDIWRCAEPIPPEWYEFDRDGLERIVETIYQRQTMIRDLISAFRRSSRHPFPN